MRRALAAACATLLASAAGAGFAAAASPDTEATVTVDTSNPGPGLAADLVGLSFEATELGTGGFDAGTGNLTALFRGLGAGNVRIGGNSLDRDVFWQPGASLAGWAVSQAEAYACERSAAGTAAAGAALVGAAAAARGAG